jgi:hypothetical protein
VTELRLSVNFYKRSACPGIVHIVACLVSELGVPLAQGLVAVVVVVVVVVVAVAN